MTDDGLRRHAREAYAHFLESGEVTALDAAITTVRKAIDAARAGCWGNGVLPHRLKLSDHGLIP
jgi:hypothetical protein